MVFTNIAICRGTGTTVNVVFRNLDLFSRSTIRMANVSETLRAGPEMQTRAFIDFDICHRKAALRMLHIVTLTSLSDNGESWCKKCELQI